MSLKLPCCAFLLCLCSILRACSQRSESCSESRFRSFFWPFPDLKALFYPLWMQSSFKSGFLKCEKGGVLDCNQSTKPDSEDLWTCKALSQRDSCVCKGSFSAVGTNSLAVCWSFDRDGGCNACDIAHSSNHVPNQEGDRDPNRLLERDSLLFWTRPLVWSCFILTLLLLCFHCGAYVFMTALLCSFHTSAISSLSPWIWS